MIKMRPYVPSNRIAIRDSIDEEISDDVDDDVFIKDARTAKVIIYTPFKILTHIYILANKFIKRIFISPLYVTVE